MFKTLMDSRIKKMANNLTEPSIWMMLWKCQVVKEIIQVLLLHADYT